MLIIIEGCDATGKTTLAKRIAELQPDTTIVHCGPPTIDAYTEYASHTSQYIPNLGASVVFDRFHIGELVYGPIYRGKSSLTQSQQVKLEAALNERGALLVHLTHKPQVLLERQRSLGEDFLKPQHIAKVVTGFKKQVLASEIKHKYTFTDPNEKDAKFLVDIARVIERGLS